MFICTADGTIETVMNTENRSRISSVILNRQFLLLHQVLRTHTINTTGSPP